MQTDSALATPLVELLLAAHAQQRLDSHLTSALLPALAEALTPVLERFYQRKGAPPDLPTLAIIANNFNLDAVRVTELLHNEAPWLTLWQQLERATQLKFPFLSDYHQEAITARTFDRVRQHLPNFLYLSRFTTWVSTILLNEYLRLKPKIAAEPMPLPAQEVITIPLPSYANHNDLWARLHTILDEFELNLLRAKLAGYSQSEIAVQTGLSNATITRRWQQIENQLRADPHIRELANEWR